MAKRSVRSERHDGAKPIGSGASWRPRAVALLALAAALQACRGGISEDPPIHLVLDMDFQPKLKAQSESTFPGWTDHRGNRQAVAGTLARAGTSAAGAPPGEYRILSPDAMFASYDRDRDGALDRVECRELPFQGHLFGVADADRNDELSHDEVVAIAKIYTYKNADGSYVAENPLPATPEVLLRGRERFNINCAVCHGMSGKAGAVSRRWPVPVPDLVAHADETTRLRLIGLPFGELFETMTKGKGTMPPYGPQVAVEDRWAIAHYVKALQKHFN